MQVVQNALKSLHNTHWATSGTKIVWVFYGIFRLFAAFSSVWFTLSEYDLGSRKLSVLDNVHFDICHYSILFRLDPLFNCLSDCQWSDMGWVCVYVLSVSDVGWVGVYVLSVSGVGWVCVYVLSVSGGGWVCVYVLSVSGVGWVGVYVLSVSGGGWMDMCVCAVSVMCVCAVSVRCGLGRCVCAVSVRCGLGRCVCAVSVRCGQGMCVCLHHQRSCACDGLALFLGPSTSQQHTQCSSQTDLLRKLHMLPHWDRSCRSTMFVAQSQRAITKPTSSSPDPRMPTWTEEYQLFKPLILFGWDLNLGLLHTRWTC